MRDNYNPMNADQKKWISRIVAVNAAGAILFQYPLNPLTDWMIIVLNVIVSFIVLVLMCQVGVFVYECIAVLFNKIFGSKKRTFYEIDDIIATHFVLAVILAIPPLLKLITHIKLL